MKTYTNILIIIIFIGMIVSCLNFILSISQNRLIDSLKDYNQALKYRYELLQLVCEERN